MPAISLDTADRLAADPARLSPSLLAYVGHPAYGATRSFQRKKQR
jgi:hypothetical protein